MTTQKQIEANRRNAQSSTGPKTEAGKAASSANAISHGLTAAGDVLLQDESVDAFEELQRDMLADLAPQDALQGMLARRIVQLLWRLDRAARLEAELFLHGELAAKRDKLRAPGPNNATAPRSSASTRTRTASARRLSPSPWTRRTGPSRRGAGKSSPSTWRLSWGRRRRWSWWSARRAPGRSTA